MIYCLALSNQGREFLVMICAEPYGPCCYRTVEHASTEFSHYLQTIKNTPENSAVHKQALKYLLNLNPSIVGFEEIQALSEIRKWSQNSVYRVEGEILKGRTTDVLLMKTGFIAGFEQVNIIKDGLKITPEFMADHIAISKEFSWDILTRKNIRVGIGCAN